MDKVSEIEELIQKGDFTQAQTQIEKIRTRPKNEPLLQIRLAYCHASLGNPRSAIRVLGKEFTQTELETSTEEQLSLQRKVAVMLAVHGARYAADRLFERLENVLEKRDDLSASLRKTLYIAIGIHGIRTVRYDQAISYLSQALEISPSEKDYTLPSLPYLNLADAYVWAGEIEKGIAMAEDLLTKIPQKEFRLRAMIETHIADDYSHKADWERCKLHIARAREVFGDTQVKDTLNFRHLEAEIALVEGEKEKAIQFFWDCYEYSRKGRPLHYVILRPIWRLTQVAPEEVPFGLALPVRAHFLFMLWPYTLGKPLMGLDISILPPWMRDQYRPYEADCWLVKDNQVESAIYSDFKDESPWVIDLVSGIELKGGKIEIFSEIQAHLLMAVLSTGDIGAHLWALVDFVYRQDFFDPEAGLKRLENLIHNMAKKGHVIKREESTYFYPIPDGATVILPMGSNSVGPTALMAKYGDSFVRADVEKILQTSKDKAQRLIKLWLEEGKVRKDVVKGQPVYQIAP